MFIFIQLMARLAMSIGLRHPFRATRNPENFRWCLCKEFYIFLKNIGAIGATRSSLRNIDKQAHLKTIFKQAAIVQDVPAIKFCLPPKNGCFEVPLMYVPEVSIFLYAIFIVPCIDGIFFLSAIPFFFNIGAITKL